MILYVEKPASAAAKAAPKRPAAKPDPAGPKPVPRSDVPMLRMASTTVARLQDPAGPVVPPPLEPPAEPAAPADRPAGNPVPPVAAPRGPGARRRLRGLGGDF